MLAPSTSRPGVAKSGARVRLAEKAMGHPTDGSIGPQSPSSGGGGGDVVKLRPAAAAANGTGPGKSGGKFASSSSGTPLHLRMVSDVEFVVYPFSLMFVDSACEVDYLKCAARRWPAHARRVALCLFLFLAISVAFDAAMYSDNGVNSDARQVYLVRVILTGVCLLATLLLAAASRTSIPYHPWPQLALMALLTTCGSLWAVACVYGNDTLVSSGAELRATDSGGYVAFVLVLHGAGRILFFHLSCIPSGISTIVYIIASVHWSPSAEQRVRVAWQCLVAIGCTLTCWFIGYRLELLKRWSHLSLLKVELGRREKADLRKEAFDLRDHMYVMTLERYDIADVDKKEIEFKSPMEQAMAKLQALAVNKALPKDAFLELQKVLGLLGSSDVFRVQVSEALAGAPNVRLDNETTRYLFDLVHNDTYDNANSHATATNANHANAHSHAAPSATGSLRTYGTAAESAVSPKHALSSSHAYGLASHTKLNSGAEDGLMSGLSTYTERSPRDVHVGSANGDLQLAPALERAGTHTRFALPGQSGSIPASVLAKEERQVNELLKSMDSFNFDVFEVANLTGGKPLFFVGTALFKKYNLLSKFSIDRARLGNFLNSVENGYLKTNPYHNASHASDVACTVHYFLHNCMKSYTSDLEILALIVASLIHDYVRKNKANTEPLSKDHPGRTNQFHIATRDPLAILYNDRAVLENHHVSKSFFLLNRDESNIFSSLSSKDYTFVRKLIVDLVLATDLGAHFDFLAQFKSSVSSGALDASGDKLLGANAAANRVMIYKMSLKAADLGHSTKTLQLHEKWTHRITEEFYRQGDEERKRNIPISPFMDRQKANLPQSQIGFLNFLVVPMFTVWVKFLDLDESVCPLMDQLRRNQMHWQQQIEPIKTHSVDEPPPPTTTNNNVASAADEHKETAAPMQTQMQMHPASNQVAPAP